MKNTSLPSHHAPFAERYRAAGFWIEGVAPDHLATWARLTPERTAVVDRKGALSFAELDKLVNAAAAGLVDLGMKPGDVLAMQLPNWREFVIFQQAAIRAGGCYLPIPPQLRGADIEYMLNVTKAWAMVIPESYRSHVYQPMAQELRKRVASLKHVFVAGSADVGNHSVDDFLVRQNAAGALAEGDRRRGADELRQIIFTSGTESRPKGVLHSYNTSFFAFGAHKAKFQLSERDAIFTCSTVGHATGAHFGVELGLYLGSKIVLIERWDPAQALRLIEEQGCTMMWGAATFYSDLVRAADETQTRLTRFRLACTAGAPIPSALVAAVKQSLSAHLVTAFGQSEGHNISISDYEDEAARVSSSDGKVNTGVEFKLVDRERREVEPGAPGEFAYRGPNVCLGYIEPQHMEGAFDADGYIYSGDLATVDAQRYLKIVGRRKEIIIRGGENLSPLEIENVIYSHPSVVDAAVIGVPDVRLGQKACAVVTLKPGASLTLADLKAHFESARIAKFKTPEALMVISEFPRTPSGKIKKELLKTQVAADAQAASNEVMAHGS